MYETRTVTLKDFRDRTEERHSAGLIDDKEYEYLMLLYSDKPVEEVVDDLDEYSRRNGDFDEWLTEEELFGSAMEAIYGKNL